MVFVEDLKPSSVSRRRVDALGLAHKIYHPQTGQDCVILESTASKRKGVSNSRRRKLSRGDMVFLALWCGCDYSEGVALTSKTSSRRETWTKKLRPQLGVLIAQSDYPPAGKSFSTSLVEAYLTLSPSIFEDTFVATYVAHLKDLVSSLLDTDSPNHSSGVLSSGDGLILPEGFPSINTLRNFLRPLATPVETIRTSPKFPMWLAECDAPGGADIDLIALYEIWESWVWEKDLGPEVEGGRSAVPEAAHCSCCR